MPEGLSTKCTVECLVVVHKYSAEALTNKTHCLWDASDTESVGPCTTSIPSEPTTDVAILFEKVHLKSSTDWALS